MAFRYRAAASLDGFLADADGSLDWLFAVTGEEPDLAGFLGQVTVLVMGATTYRWVLAAERLVERPGRWRELFGERPVVVFTHRRPPVPEGADVHVLHGSVAEHLATVRALAGDGDVWVQGGGDLAGQFLDAGALDEVAVTVVPACLGGGAPLLPRRLGPERLRLRGLNRTGQYADLVYDVLPVPGR